MTPELFSLLRRRISVVLLGGLVSMFRGLTGWRDADAARFAAQAVPTVQGAQRYLASATAAYMASRASEALRRPVAPPAIPDLTGLRAGVQPLQVYQRPLIAARVALSEGHGIDEARQRGVTRLEQVAELDLQQTYAHAAQQSMQNLPRGVRPRQWRRVLVGAENCSRCVAAAGVLWDTDQLNPLHNNCNCRIEAVYGDDSPEQGLLESADAALGELTGQPVKPERRRRVVRRMVRVHGEAGPLLTKPRDHFTSAEQLPTDRSA